MPIQSTYSLKPKLSRLLSKRKRRSSIKKASKVRTLSDIRIDTLTDTKTAAKILYEANNWRRRANVTRHTITPRSFRPSIPKLYKPRVEWFKLQTKQPIPVVSGSLGTTPGSVELFSVQLTSPGPQYDTLQLDGFSFTMSLKASSPKGQFSVFALLDYGPSKKPYVWNSILGYVDPNTGYMKTSSEPYISFKKDYTRTSRKHGTRKPSNLRNPGKHILVHRLTDNSYGYLRIYIGGLPIVSETLSRQPTPYMTNHQILSTIQKVGTKRKAQDSMSLETDRLTKVPRTTNLNSFTPSPETKLTEDISLSDLPVFDGLIKYRVSLSNHA